MEDLWEKNLGQIMDKFWGLLEVLSRAGCVISIVIGFTKILKCFIYFTAVKYLVLAL